MGSTSAVMRSVRTTIAREQGAPCLFLFPCSTVELQIRQDGRLPAHFFPYFLSSLLYFNIFLPSTSCKTLIC